MKFRLFLLLILTLLCISYNPLLSQFSKNQQNPVYEKIVGKWRADGTHNSKFREYEAKAIFIFASDGSMVLVKGLINKSLAKENGDWEIRSDSLIITLYKGGSSIKLEERSNSDTIKLGPGIITLNPENKKIYSMKFSEGSIKKIQRILRYKYTLDKKDLKLFDKDIVLTLKKVKE